ncbi:MAG: phenylpyruvate tautomerase MIF-related protein [Gammaproteobacteria bacterium]|nr:phenylpyruvate tautomerase MIF-related protein [Gammaproteobacteria bacterium]
MPLLNINTNNKLDDKQQLALAASAAVAKALGKPESYVMVQVSDKQALVFAASGEPAAYLELKSIGLPEPETARLSTTLCELINKYCDIDPARIYIEFSNAQRHMWGWNGATF